MDITFITSNPAKAKQLGWHLGYPIKHQAIDLPEIQSLDVEGVVKEKAKTAYGIINKPVLVEDYSLVFDVLGKLPGPFVKWFLQEIGSNGLCKLLDNYTNRSAVATSAAGLYDGKRFYLFKSEMRGTISKEPRGKEVFGTDAIFIPEGHQKTWSEMSKEEQLATSVRGAALKQLEKHLHQFEPVKIGR